MNSIILKELLILKNNKALKELTNKNKNICIEFDKER